jgi:CheY-like chemotaxis protein
MSKRILVVEDQEDNRQIIRDMLAGMDYEITEAEDGQEAFKATSAYGTKRTSQRTQLLIKLLSAFNSAPACIR